MPGWPTTIYVVDNETTVRTAFSRLLRSAGFDVVPFCSAVKFFEQSTIDPDGCILTDIHMPEMSGLEIPAHLKLHGLSIPVIMITAVVDEAILLRAEKLSERVLQKPVDEKDLIAAIASLAKSRVSH